MGFRPTEKYTMQYTFFPSSLIPLKMEAAMSSETLATLYRYASLNDGDTF